jgi:hypothetical protein
MSRWDDAKDIMEFSFIENRTRKDGNDTIDGRLVFRTGGTDGDDDSVEKEMVEYFKVVSCISCGDR